VMIVAALIVAGVEWYRVGRASPSPDGQHTGR
jgi:hypothetical protein